MKKEQIIRHGDMVLVKVSEAYLKENGYTVKTPVDKLVVGLGEVTGHSHDVIPTSDCEILQYSKKEGELDDANADVLVFELIKGVGLITHEEHNAIALEKGIYTRLIQRAYDPWEEISRRVAD